MLLCFVNADAQSLKVYYVGGNVTGTVKQAKKSLQVGDVVTYDTHVSIPFEGKLELLDEKSSKRITIKTPGTGTISQLSKASGNSVAAISERYVTYVKNQMTHKGLSSKQRLSDFATVTRSVALADDEDKPKSFDDIFNEFSDNATKKFESFRDSCNQVFIEAVRKNWESMGAAPAVKKPKEQKLAPEKITINETATTNGMRQFGERVLRAGKMILDVFKEKKLESTAKPVEPIKEVKQTVEEKKYSGMPFTFFGTEMSVRLDESQRINLGNINPDRVADALTILSKKNYDNLLYDCLALKEKYNLCDWAYLLMVKEIADQFCGQGTNEASLVMGYVLYQSGYKIKVASDVASGMSSSKAHLYLLVASRHDIIDYHYWKLDGDNYYAMDDVPTSVYICKAKFPKEQDISLYVSEMKLFDNHSDATRIIRSQRYPEMEVEVSVNKGLLNFYEKYPSSTLNDDITTRWVMYAETPMNSDVKKQLYPVLKKQLEGLSEYDAVARLLNFVQTGFEYKLDDLVWGEDRVFFAEESLYYPYCDCEDRSILFTRLVRDLVGLECVLLYYPGHLASAVHFNDKVGGDRYEINDKDYVVCDATYIAANIGRQIKEFANTGATVIPIR